MIFLWQGDMRFVGIVVGVLILTVEHVPAAPYPDHNVIAIAAAAGNGGGQGVSGRPQKNATVKGTPKINSTIDGSQIRGKH
jgi:hypothetical protein